MEECLEKLIYKSILIWIDDILLFAKTYEDFFINLQRFFQILKQYGFKLNLKKCRLFLSEVKWCGKVYSGKGTAYDNEKTNGLIQMNPPTTAGELQ